MPKKDKKDPAKSLAKLLDRARGAHAGVDALVRRAEASANALAGAVRDLERLMAARDATTASPAPRRVTAKRVPAKRTPAKRTASKSAPAKRTTGKRTSAKPAAKRVTRRTTR
jgi:hypothetical protein